MLTNSEQSKRWLWPRYNPEGLLVGPLPYKRVSTIADSPDGDEFALRELVTYVPDYSYPGVAERVRVEVDFIIDQERYRD